MGKLINRLDLKKMKQNSAISLSIGAIWMILSWLTAYGINSMVLFPFNFISGSLLGLNGGSIIGGILGRTILLIIFTSFIRTIIFSKGSLKERINKSSKSLKSALICYIPNSDNIKDLVSNKNIRRAYYYLGFGLAFITYPFITGNGSFNNSGVSLFLSLALIKEVHNQRGLISSLIKGIYFRLKQKSIDQGKVLCTISGNALGLAVTIILALIRLNYLIIQLAGLIILATGIITLYAKSSKKAKVIVCQEIA